MRNRLIKNCEEYLIPNGLIVNVEDKINDINTMTDTTYGPSYDKSWIFEQPISDSEWRLRESYKKK